MKLNYTISQEHEAKVFASQVSIRHYEIKYHQEELDARQKVFIGKLGEFAVWNLFTQFNNTMIPPDTTIYTKPTFNADLEVNGVGISIKTQELTKAKYYESWLFKNNEIPTLTNKIIAGCFYEAGEIRLALLLKAPEADAGFGLPYADKYKHTHQALYPNWLKHRIDESLLY